MTAAGWSEPLCSEGEPQGWGKHNIEEPQRGINYGDSYPLADTTVLYYWRFTYWRRLVS